MEPLSEQQQVSQRLAQVKDACIYQEEKVEYCRKRLDKAYDSFFTSGSRVRMLNYELVKEGNILKILDGYRKHLSRKIGEYN